MCYAPRNAKFYDFRGQLPAAAELSYLEKVKWLEMYGVDLHPVLVSIMEKFINLTDGVILNGLVCP